MKTGQVNNGITCSPIWFYNCRARSCNSNNGGAGGGQHPSFFNTGQYQQRGFYDETIAAIRYAQKYAIASGCTIRAEIVLNTGYRLWRATPANCTTGPYNVALLNLAGSNYLGNAPAGVNISAADISFTNNGSVVGGADVVITITGRPNITVIGATGFVQR